jgi:hypothetical protein
VASAGDDQTVIDSDNSGAEIVNLDASGSTDADGTIANYRWQEGATLLAEGTSPLASVSLPVGLHAITLTVTDNDGATATDSVNVTVSTPPPPACAWQSDDCVADYNNDGGIDGDDVIAFFIDWDNSNPCADVDASGSVDGDDVIVFFGQWDANGVGTPGC